MKWFLMEQLFIELVAFTALDLCSGAPHPHLCSLASPLQPPLLLSTPVLLLNPVVADLLRQKGVEACRKKSTPHVEDL